jgi:uncharacterized protein (TIGR03435 family)
MRRRGVRISQLWNLLMRNVVVLTSAAVLWGALGPLSLQAQEAPRQPFVDFGRDIRPIFEQTCYGCHSGSARRGQLRLDVGALALKGGSSGPLLVPGNSGKSLLMARLKGENGQPQMPMGSSLFDEEIALVARWIDQGAEWPDAGASAAQVSERPPLDVAFEAASIRPTSTNPGNVASPDRFVRTGTLRQLIQYGYGLPPFQVISGPEWVGSEVFDVNAKAAFVPTPDEMRAMVRRLLAERFQVKTSAATREMPIYFLRPARGDRRLGPQLTATTVDCAAVEADRLRKGENAPTRTASGAKGQPVCTTWVSARPMPGGVAVRYQSSGTSSAELASFLAQYVGRPVVDDTRLNGDFDIDLSFIPPGVPSPTATPADDTAMLFTALEEQLGLKLEPARGPVEVLVIDSVERPTPN